MTRAARRLAALAATARPLSPRACAVVATALARRRRRRRRRRRVAPARPSSSSSARPAPTSTRDSSATGPSTGATPPTKARAEFTLIGDASPRAATSRATATQLRARCSPSRPNAPTPTLVWLVLIGHGTLRRRDGQVQPPRPRRDRRGARRVAGADQAPLAVIDCTSASAPFSTPPRPPNRVVIAATKSGNELNFARFGQYLAEAIADPRGRPRQGRPDVAAGGVPHRLPRRRGVLRERSAAGHRARAARRQRRRPGHARRLVPRPPRHAARQGRRRARRPARPPVPPRPQRPRSAHAPRSAPRAATSWSSPSPQLRPKRKPSATTSTTSGSSRSCSSSPGSTRSSTTTPRRREVSRPTAGIFGLRRYLASRRGGRDVLRRRAEFAEPTKTGLNWGVRMYNDGRAKTPAHAPADFGGVDLEDLFRLHRARTSSAATQAAQFC